MRIATWNVNSVTVRMGKMREWLPAAAPDVVCLQELKATPEQFPTADFTALGYECAVNADGRWNGVAILSRLGLSEVVSGLSGEPTYEGATERRAIGATCGGVRVWSVYVPNGREPGHPHYAYKLEWLDALRATVAAELTATRPYAVLGDFNVAPNDSDVWDVTAFEGLTHVTPQERAALAELRALGLDDVVPRAMKYDTPFTYWDYRAGNFHKNLGMRIDLVYANPAFVSAVTDAYVDREARKGSLKEGKGPSDHAPVVVDLDL
ncbi:MAG TPA: exodeoxyribonuclease III [Acidimicrobiales bacterium]|nr:exodeoxyribonuclease III [Actinomycetes bacterium]HVN51618.1 exodeoxyribonuclease III [Acidimicrobiales bacterium]